jgi:hypothetical protein
MSAENDDRRITIRLASQARDALDRIASLLGGITIAEAIRRIIGTTLYLLEEQQRGCRILIEHPDTHVTRELIMK